MLKRFAPLLLTSLLLIGCGNTANDETKAEELDEVSEVSPVNHGHFVDTLQTSFAVNSTKLPELTDEEERIVKEIDTHVNEVTSKSNYDEDGEVIYYGDRELVDMVAGDYPEYTSEELYDMRNDYYTISFYDGFGEYYVDHKDLADIHNLVLESNLNATEIKYDTGEISYNEDYSMVLNTGKFYLDGVQTDYMFVLEFNNDYTEAVLIRLVVDGVEAFESVPDHIPANFNN